jgi:hypothetical protein
LRGLIQKNNLYLQKIQGLELIVSGKREITRTHKKWKETLRRLYLPNGRVKRRRYNEKPREISADYEVIRNNLQTIYVPWSSPVARKIVQAIHNDTGHGSLPVVESVVKRTWFLPKITRIYKDVRKACPYCKVMDAKPFALPEGGILEERTVSQHPFDVTGLDFTGRLGCLNDKAYYSESGELSTFKIEPTMCIFTCANTRAVSLQPCRDESYKSFQNAYDRFRFTRNVRPLLIRSDNAHTFKHASVQERIRAQSFRTKWEFNPVRAAWWGSAYERLIGFIKQKMAFCFLRQKFQDMDDFSAAVAFLENLVNNRPICIVRGSSPEDYTVIRPAQFLNTSHEDNFERQFANILDPRTEDSMTGIQMDLHLKQQRNFLIRLKRVFDHHYVDALRKYHQNKLFQKTGEKSPVVKVGDTVLIKPTNTFKETSPLSRIKWEIGKVVRATLNRYNEVRTVDVEYFNEDGKLKLLENQPIQFFAPLEVDDHEAFIQKVKQPAEIPDEMN